MAELALEDGTIWYDTTGEGHPLVFVHGGWLNGRTWRSQVEHFADEYRIATVDVRGHGHTGSTDPKRYSVELFADDLEAVCAELDLERPIFCGLSLGSMVVQEYLARHPDRATGAILAGALRSMPSMAVPPSMKSFVSPTPALTATLSMMGPTATFRSMLGSIRAMTGDRWLTVDPAVRSEALEAVGDVSPAEFRKVFDALYRYDPPDLSNVKTPTLVIHGDREAPVVARQGQRIATMVDHGRRIVVDDAGHLVNQDRPAAFNDESETFLAALDLPTESEPTRA
ncbi:alpha/beta hydrolase [Natrialba sp. INN-245]|uniref:alpha/beta fold hydrolase n=1 Tax=Natrialba sp. INN-245 TaxID=2690967 RepID=UPI001311B978|nr:alpha/beta hydrolase [Natrialba sp. INN-245]MWV39565.1 alpha/beta fold hydrolase [Natrialba sp. INN-245]